MFLRLYLLFYCYLISMQNYLTALCGCETLINKVTEPPVIASIYSLERIEVDRE